MGEAAIPPSALPPGRPSIASRTSGNLSPPKTCRAQRWGIGLDNKRSILDERISGADGKASRTPESAAVAIQRAFRLQLSIYRNVGADIFCLWNGKAPYYGTISFTASLLSEPAPFITVSDTSSPAYLSHYLTRQWRIEPPEVIFSVIGGAQDFTLAPQLLAVFSDGLNRAVSSCKAWIITGGTDTGVMKVIGSVMADSPVKVPIIGIGPWGAINGCNQLAARGAKVNYDNSTKPGIDGAPLNSQHSHFVLIDSGKEGRHAWGGEIETRFEFEDYLAGTMRVPLAVLVVQGGPGTMTSVATIASKGHPIVVMVDAGGAGAAIHSYVKHGLDAVEPHFHKMEPDMERIKEANDAHSGKLLTFFSLKGDTMDLSKAILQAIVSIFQFKATTQDVLSTFASGALAGLAGGPCAADVNRSASSDAAPPPSRKYSTDSKMISLAINWNRIDIARSLLMSQSAKANAKRIVAQALQHAFLKRRADFVKMLLGLPASDLSLLDICPLYATSTVVPDMYHFLSSDRPLQRR